jgi:hypothetical protein
MKKLKYVNSFENFKINEEVPYNYDYSDKSKNKWLDDQKKDLENLGADEIGSDYANFNEPSGVVTIKTSKDGDNIKFSFKSDYNILNKKFKRLTNKITSYGTFSKTGEYINVYLDNDDYCTPIKSNGIKIIDWSDFLDIFNNFMNYIKNKTSTVDDTTSTVDGTTSKNKNDYDDLDLKSKTGKWDDKYGDTSRFDNETDFLGKYDKDEVENWKYEVDKFRKRNKTVTSKAPVLEPFKKKRWWE